MDIDKNEELAKKAYELCEKAYKDKDIELARIYLMNALTHSTEVSYLKALITIVKKTPFAVRREIAQQALNMFSMALFQAPAEQVAEIRNLIDEMQEVYDSSFAFDRGPVEVQKDAPATWDEVLNSYSWSVLRQAGELNDVSKIQTKASILQRLVDAGPSANRERIEREFRMTVSYLDFLAKEQTLKAALSDVEGEFATKKNPFYLAAKLQNASTILSQMWLLDITDVVPPEKFRALLSDYSAKVEVVEKKYLQLKGLPVFEELKKKIDEALAEVPDEKDKKTPVLDRWQKVIQTVSSRIQELADPEQVSKIQELLRKLGDASEKLSRARYADYQAFCAGRCKAAIKSFDDTIKVSEEDSLKYLERCDLAKIDETLLSPEASAMFHEAKGMLVDKLSRMKRADFQVKCVIGEKFALEDF